MNKIVKDKSILVGDEKLVKKDKWVSYNEINESMNILKHKIFRQTFNKIVREHQPKHNIAFLSLCTSTRPYHLGRKWKQYIKTFSGKVDLIVLSSGGIIPQDYWNSFPFLNYDGKTSPPGFEELYAKLMDERLSKFFKIHHYDYVVANFRPNIRNAVIAQKTLARLKKYGKIKDFVLVPDKEAYEELQKRGFPGGKMYPDLDVKIFEHIENAVNKFVDLSKSNKEQLFVEKLNES